MKIWKATLTSMCGGRYKDNVITFKFEELEEDYEVLSLSQGIGISGWYYKDKTNTLIVVPQIPRRQVVHYGGCEVTQGFTQPLTTSEKTEVEKLFRQILKF